MTTFIVLVGMFGFLILLWIWRCERKKAELLRKREDIPPVVYPTNSWTHSSGGGTVPYSYSSPSSSSSSSSGMSAAERFIIGALVGNVFGSSESHSATPDSTPTPSFEGDGGSSGGGGASGSWDSSPSDSGSSSSSYDSGSCYDSGSSFDSGSSSFDSGGGSGGW